MSFDSDMSSMGTQYGTFFVNVKVQIWNTNRLKMQVTGVIAIENIYKDKIVKMVRDTILLNLRSKSINLPKFGFIRTTKSRIWLFSNSMSNPNVRSDRNIEEK